MKKDFVSRFLKENAENEIINKNDKIIVGLSGGVDSVGLFLLLSEIKDIFNIKIIAVHINHKIRTDADKDMEFVSNLCSKYNIQCITYIYDIPKLSKEEGIGLEECGRKYRRLAFEEVMEKYDYDKIALAHHSGDQAETILMNLFRGTGPKGFGGIKKVDNNYIRPILSFSKKEITDYVSECDEKFVEDETNKSNDYKRNYVRNKLIPNIEKNINNRASEHIIQASKKMIDIYNFTYKSIVQDIKPKYVKYKDSNVTIDDEIRYRYPKVIVEIIIQDILIDISKKRKDITQAHLDSIYNLFDNQVSKKVDIIYGIEAVKTYTGITISKKTQAKSLLEFRDINDYVDIEIVDKKNISEDEYKKNNIYTKYFNYDIIDEYLYIRNRRSGDRIFITDNKTKKLSDYFINEKIPIDKRDKIPLIVSKNEIIWVVGYRISEKYKVTNSTKKVLIITYKKEIE